jgi:hypothetical protein
VGSYRASASGTVVAVYGGLDCYLFNATSTLVPGTGGVAGLELKRSVWGLNWVLRGESGLIRINGERAIPLKGGLGVDILID